MSALKIGVNIVSSPVSWRYVTEEAVEIELTSSNKTISLPISPQLPFGVYMCVHRDWIAARADLLADWESASFEQCDLIVDDLEKIRSIVGWNTDDDFIPYSTRKDWREWSTSFEDAWVNRSQEIEQLFETLYPEKDFNRKMPPTLIEALKSMLEAAGLGET